MNQSAVNEKLRILPRLDRGGRPLPPDAFPQADGRERRPLNGRALKGLTRGLPAWQAIKTLSTRY